MMLNCTCFCLSCERPAFGCFPSFSWRQSMSVNLWVVFVSQALLLCVSGVPRLVHLDAVPDWWCQVNCELDGCPQHAEDCTCERNTHGNTNTNINTNADTNTNAQANSIIAVWPFMRQQTNPNLDNTITWPFHDVADNAATTNVGTNPVWPFEAEQRAAAIVEERVFLPWTGSASGRNPSSGSQTAHRANRHDPFRAFEDLQNADLVLLPWSLLWHFCFWEKKAKKKCPDTVEHPCFLKFTPGCHFSHNYSA